MGADVSSSFDTSAYPVANLVDGDTASLIATTSGTGNWASIEIPPNTIVGYAAVYNRNGRYAYLLGDFEVYVGTAAEPYASLCDRVEGYAEAGPRIVRCHNAVGDRVRLLQTGSARFLTIGELYACSPTPPSSSTPPTSPPFPPNSGRRNLHEADSGDAFGESFEDGSGDAGSGSNFEDISGNTGSGSYFEDVSSPPPSSLLEELPDGSVLTVQVQATANTGRTTTAITIVTVDRFAPVASSLLLRWAGMQTIPHATSITGSASCIPSAVSLLDVEWDPYEDTGSAVRNYSLLFLNATDVSSFEVLSTTGEPISQSVGAAASAIVTASTMFAQSTSVALATSGCDQAGSCAQSEWHYVYQIEAGPSNGSVTIVNDGNASGGFASDLTRLESVWDGFDPGTGSALFWAAPSPDPPSPPPPSQPPPPPELQQLLVNHAFLSSDGRAWRIEDQVNGSRCTNMLTESGDESSLRTDIGCAYWCANHASGAVWSGDRVCCSWDTDNHRCTVSNSADTRAQESNSSSWSSWKLDLLQAPPPPSLPPPSPSLPPSPPAPPPLPPDTVASIDDFVSLLSYEVCIGTTPYGCQVQDFASVGTDTRWTGSGLSLECGATHYVAVRATNCAGLQRTVASSGAKLCCSTPTAGTVKVVDESGAEMSYLGNASLTSASVSWSGFADTCSGIREYRVSLLQTNDSTLLWISVPFDSSEISTHLPYDVVANLAHGEHLTVIVNAFSQAGLSSTAATSFHVDRTKPIIGAIYNGNLRNVACQPLGQPLEVSWNSIADDDSGISSIAWSIGFSEGNDDLRSATNVEGDSGAVVRQWAYTAANGSHVKGIEVGMLLHSTLTVTNGARDSVAVSIPPVRIVDPNCTTSFVCVPAAHGGVLPWMVPLVASLVYDVSGQFMPPGFMRESAELHLRVNLVSGQRLADSSRITLLAVSRHSVLIDKYGSPVHGLPEDLMRHPSKFGRPHPRIVPLTPPWCPGHRFLLYDR